MSAELKLKHPFPLVCDGSHSFYGGSQRLLFTASSRKLGCGVVTIGNILLYLGRYHEGCGGGPWAELSRRDPIPAQDFGRCADELQKKYLPLLPGLGLTGVQLAWGFNRYCRKYGLPFRLSWQFGGGRIWQHLRTMLEKDIPVPLAIGSNFPAFWGHSKLTLYRREQEEPRPATAVKAHFVTVTGKIGDWLRISSWGREYYISQSEFQAYAGGSSSYLVSNLGLIRGKGG